MRRSPLRIALTLAAIATIVAVRYATDRDTAAPETSPRPAPSAAPAKPGNPPPPPTATPIARPAGASRPTNAAIVDAFRRRQSDVWVEGSGTVEATLPDDREGSRHQKFIVRIDRELTVLVSHNIDLAPRVPLDRGDTVSFRGEYVWNAKGGLVHWTHHDPRGGRGGWIRHGDGVYE
jgi:hypothetical protein